MGRLIRNAKRSVFAFGTLIVVEEASPLIVTMHPLNTDGASEADAFSLRSLSALQDPLPAFPG